MTKISQRIVTSALVSFLAVGLVSCGEEKSQLELDTLDAPNAKLTGKENLATTSKTPDDTEDASTSSDGQSPDAVVSMAQTDFSNIVEASKTFDRGTDSDGKPLNISDVSNFYTAKKIEKMLGASVFFERSTPSLLERLNNVPIADIERTNSQLEKEYPFDRDASNYGTLSPQEKLLANFFIAELAHQVAALGDISDIRVEPKDIIENAKDRVVPASAMKYMQDSNEYSLYDFEFRYFKDGDSWKLDTYPLVDAIERAYSAPAQ